MCSPRNRLWLYAAKNRHQKQMHNTASQIRSTSQMPSVRHTREEIKKTKSIENRIKGEVNYSKEIWSQVLQRVSAILCCYTIHKQLWIFILKADSKEDPCSSALVFLSSIFLYIELIFQQNNCFATFCLHSIFIPLLVLHLTTWNVLCSKPQDIPCILPSVFSNIIPPQHILKYKTGTSLVSSSYDQVAPQCREPGPNCWSGN